MTEREKILGRVREALTIEAPRPGHHGHHNARLPAVHAPAGGFRDFLPATGDSLENRLALFRENAVALRADFHWLNHEDELRALLPRLRDAEGWKRAAMHRAELTTRAGEILGLPVLKTDGGYEVKELDQCDVGITECDALIAQTGSVLVTSRSAGGRALSVLPPHHLVLARREQLLRDLPEAFELLKQKYGGNYPSMISFITGPSRTGDIERIIVLGAHGPKKLTIVCW